MSTIIYGKNAISASLSNQRVKTLFVSARLKDDRFTLSLPLQGVSVKYVNDGELTRLAKTDRHQGFVACVKDYETVSLDKLIEKAKATEYPLIVMLDGIEDPHNLGAILRSCDAFGVNGVIMKSHGEVPLNGTVAKVSTGAIDFVPVSVVNNLSQAISTLKENGYWVVASDGASSTLYDSIDYRSPICLVVGSEGFGISRLVLKNSDFVVKIPMVGHVNSLNASVATSVFLSMIDHKRRI